jgi:hypothetical protein
MYIKSSALLKEDAAMKRITVIAAVLAGLLALGLTEASAQDSQLVTEKRPVSFAERNMSGPRLGFTVVPGNSALAQKMKENNVGPIVSQFGWHFEWAVIPDGGGPSFVIEFIPLIGGVEYKKVIPSFSLPMGVRFPDGIEFGLGPNLTATNDGVKTSLVIAIGKSFGFGGVSIPVNLAVATNPEGNRYSLLFGYAIGKI